ncbi:DUF896 domain-containing protein [Facklamia sp. P13055]|uniref:DUF896 domain-containing protein n=1 Tax=Facklamia sp. P13055 TaxID=3421952 RepID=UPI003D16A29D
MLSSSKLARINELAKLQKTKGLTDSEKEEQNQLRQEYLKVFRQHMVRQVEGVKIVDSDGNDLTPEKVKRIQKAKGIHNRKD